MPIAERLNVLGRSTTGRAYFGSCSGRLGPESLDLTPELRSLRRSSGSFAPRASRNGIEKPGPSQSLRSGVKSRAFVRITESTDTQVQDNQGSHRRRVHHHHQPPIFNPLPSCRRAHHSAASFFCGRQSPRRKPRGMSATNQQACTFPRKLPEQPHWAWRREQHRVA